MEVSWVGGDVWCAAAVDVRGAVKGMAEAVGLDG